jgi:hypothetical protein
MTLLNIHYSLVNGTFSLENLATPVLALSGIKDEENTPKEG